MAYFDKDIYFRKQIYAERKMIENREIENSLNEKQKNTIESICTIRHRIHSDPKDAE